MVLLMMYMILSSGLGLGKYISLRCHEVKKKKKDAINESSSSCDS